MTNYEWLVRNHAGLIKEIIPLNFGVTKKGIVKTCLDAQCVDCIFNNDYECRKNAKEWLEKEREPLYKKGDIVINHYNQINIITEDYYDGDFISMSQYSDSIGKRMPIKNIKKVGHIESEG